MARPVKAEHEKMTEVAQMRCTLAELEFIRAQAAAAELTLSDFLRRRSLSLPVQPPPGRADAALLAELNRIGVNVNQLAFAHNADREFRGRWQDIADALEAIMEKVSAVYGS
jgi:hypothetical protein